MVRKEVDKIAQLQISFGMIFSIILIVVFLGFGFWGIMKVLSFSDFSQISKFIDGVQKDVDDLWKGTQGVWSPKEGYTVPKKVDYVCFVDFSKDGKGKNENLMKELQPYNNGNENLVFLPGGVGEDLNSIEIKHIDIEKITAENNPYCFEEKDGKVKITLEKKYGETLVTIR